MLLLRNTVETDSGRCSGQPVLVGTRFPAAQIVGQIASGDSVDDLAENFDLDKELIVSFLDALALRVAEMRTTP